MNGWALLVTSLGLSSGMARLFITGGTGFIGSHTCIVLLQAGHSCWCSTASPTAHRLP